MKKKICTPLPLLCPLLCPYLPVHGIRKHAKLAPKVLHHTLKAQAHPEGRYLHLQHLIQQNFTGGGKEEGTDGGTEGRRDGGREGGREGGVVVSNKALTHTQRTTCRNKQTKRSKNNKLQATYLLDGIGQAEVSRVPRPRRENNKIRVGVASLPHPSKVRLQRLSTANRGHLREKTTTTTTTTTQAKRQQRQHGWSATSIRLIPTVGHEIIYRVRTFHLFSSQKTNKQFFGARNLLRASEVNEARTLTTIIILITFCC